MLGSVATGTIQRATIPVLLVRPRTSQETAEGQSVRTESPSDEPVALRPGGEPDPRATVVVCVSADDLQLIERGLKALAYMPDCPHHDVLSSETLAKRLEQTAHTQSRDPVMTG